MINHARTLLLNQPGKNYAPGTLGEEYVLPDYVAAQLPSYLQLPHRILFGVSPDKVFLNFRAHELMSLIHATELEEFVYALDPRVTYWPQTQNEFFSPPKAISQTKLPGYNGARMHLLGRPSADNVRGRVFNEYFVQLVATDGEVSVVITSNANNESVTQPLSFVTETSKLSNPVTFPDGSLRAQFSNIVDIAYELLLMEQVNQALLAQNYNAIMLEDGDVLPFTLSPQTTPVLGSGDTVLARWHLQTYARPGDAISACLPRLELLGEPLFLELFGVRNDIQPYATFKNIWFDHPMPNYRLAAFVLAMIYRTNETRR